MVKGAPKSKKNRCQTGFKIRPAFKTHKITTKVSNIGPSWGPKSSQVALKIEVKNHSILNGKKQGPKEMTKWFLVPTGGTPPGHLAKAKWAQKLRMRYED